MNDSTFYLNSTSSLHGYTLDFVYLGIYTSGAHTIHAFLDNQFLEVINKHIKRPEAEPDLFNPPAWKVTLKEEGISLDEHAGYPRAGHIKVIKYTPPVKP